MNDDYSHYDLNVFYTVENIPGPADSSAEYTDLINNYNSLIAGCCSCRDYCKQDTCRCLQISGGFNYKCLDNYNTIILSKSNELCPIIECNENCSCSEACYNRLVQKGPLRDLVVQTCHIKSKGLGLYTKNLIRKGTFICEYAGELLTKSQAIKRQKINTLSGKMNYIFCLNEHGVSGIVQTFVDPSSIGNIGRYINHSCNPNCHIVPVRWNTPIPKLAIFASVDIAVGEEITFHYGDHSVNTQSGNNTVTDRKECLCNSSLCNGLMPFDAY